MKTVKLLLASLLAVVFSVSMMATEAKAEKKAEAKAEKKAEAKAEKKAEAKSEAKAAK
ncbi:MAG: hypothetical protein OEV78_10355 [Spirochaetia bacterium]|nr:hypothetical protein [Spirochaetia bacterium]